MGLEAVTRIRSLTNMTDHTEYRKSAEILAESLPLCQPPVAVCFTDSLPAVISGPSVPVAAGCRFWEDAKTGPLQRLPQTTAGVPLAATRTTYRLPHLNKRI
jgi:hypothetical protein